MERGLGAHRVDVDSASEHCMIWKSLEGSQRTKSKTEKGDFITGGTLAVEHIFGHVCLGIVAHISRTTYSRL